MRKVIDSNQLQSETLRDYLSRAPTNYAVLTDYAAMEAYKGDTLNSIYKSMRVLSAFPSQVIVLKNTRVVCGLRGRTAGLQRRLIDNARTTGFANYVRSLERAEAGNVAVQTELLELGCEAEAHLQRMLLDAETTAEALAEIGTKYSKAERAAIRSGEPYSHEMVDRIVQDVIAIAGVQFSQHPNVTHRPTFQELPNTFIFLSALCTYLLALEWIAHGGAIDASPAKLRNDFVDMHFAAYATYFDGLMSADAKVRRIHREARIWLSGLFGCAMPGDVIC